MEVKPNNTKLTEEQKGQQFGFSDSTIKRYRDQMDMPSFYNRKTTKKEKMSSHDGTIKVKVKNYGTENELFSGRVLSDKVFITN